MFWIIATALLGIIGLVALLFAVGAEDRTATVSDRRGFEREIIEKAPKAAAWGVTIGCALLWGVVTFFHLVHRVGQREVGIVYSFSNTITGATGQGVVFTWPWEHVTTENIGLQNEDFPLTESNSAVSKDQQPIFGDIQLNYSLGTDNILSLYKTVGPNWKAILLEGRMLQDFKQVTSTYTAAEITTQRAALRADTKALMSQELKKYDITVNDVLIKNISYSPAYIKAISDKNVQVQKALQAKAKVAQVRAEAEQQIARATGQAKSNLLIADAQAKALAVKGKALEDHPAVLTLEAIDKLNPNASVVICTGSGSGNCPSFLPQSALGTPNAAPGSSSGK